MNKNAECNKRGNPVRVQICYGTCPEINRTFNGVEECFKRVQQDSRCGGKWFEVGDNDCMCYPSDWVECNVISDSNEDLYQIGNYILSVTCSFRINISRIGFLFGRRKYALRDINSTKL